MKLTRADGTTVDANFTVSGHGTRWAITLDSRSGARGSDRSRNPDYNEALGSLLKSLHALDATLIDASVDSSYVRAAKDRQAIVLVPNRPYPIRLNTVHDLEELRLSLTRGQRTIARRPGTLPIGGNNSKRLRLNVVFQGRMQDLENALVGGIGADAIDELLGDLSVSERGHRRRSLTSPAERRAIEARAMDVAQGHYRNAGWTVVDVSATSPYDLRCSVGRHQLAVEVKGTRGTGSVIQLTRNEVAWMRHHYPHTELFILAKIVLQSQGDDVFGTGGMPRVITRWQPDATRLVPLAFDYTVPD